MIPKNLSEEEVEAWQWKRYPDLLKNSRLPKRLQKYRWEDWDDDYSEDSESAMDDVVDYFDDLSKQVKQGVGLLIIGENGSGKTMLGALAFKDLIRYLSEPGLYITAEDYVKLSRSADFDSSWENAEDLRLYQRCYNTPILFFDGLGQERSSSHTEYAKYALLYLFKKRSDAMKINIVTTTLLLDDPEEAVPDAMLLKTRYCLHEGDEGLFYALTSYNEIVDLGV